MSNTINSFSNTSLSPPFQTNPLRNGVYTGIVCDETYAVEENSKGKIQLHFFIVRNVGYLDLDSYSDCKKALPR